MAGMMRASADQRGWGADQRGWGNEAPAKSAGRRTWAATAWLVAGTIAVAVTSYSLSLKVAAERRDVEKLARQNASLQSDLKALDAELRVRMRMPQLQRWNDSVLGMVPISATQYLANPVQLAAYGDPIEQAAPAVPHAQLAVRDLAPAAHPPAQQPLLVSAQAPARAPAMRPEPAPAAIERVSMERPSVASVGIQRPAADAPQDLIREVEVNFAAGGANQ
ncbi:hypothetical protein FJQ54_13760 [Sandaracinobacter neustonicus]|uniref:Uncharacterized protein n=1 Tax=Sandaracinobacter neustonicus TaxID=1715348 RepID=A0A501XFZ2_9SPHN|nr:hypothetical protein [Sandaracinobacter neustonicus]TPE59541.1 hypothetical protein FJQ54_13760 [Sandaracinobacter neustonicus]